MRHRTTNASGTARRWAGAAAALTGLAALTYGAPAHADSGEVDIQVTGGGVDCRRGATLAYDLPNVITHGETFAVTQDWQVPAQCARAQDSPGAERPARGTIDGYLIPDDVAFEPAELGLHDVVAVASLDRVVRFKTGPASGGYTCEPDSGPCQGQYSAEASFDDLTAPPARYLLWLPPHGRCLYCGRDGEVLAATLPRLEIVAAEPEGGHGDAKSVALRRRRGIRASRATDRGRWRPADRDESGAACRPLDRSWPAAHHPAHRDRDPRTVVAMTRRDGLLQWAERNRRPAVPRGRSMTS